jgi:hypothetical protein
VPPDASPPKGNAEFVRKEAAERQAECCSTSEATVKDLRWHHPIRGCKPKTPKIPSRQLKLRHDRIQVDDDLSVATKGAVLWAQNSVGSMKLLPFLAAFRATALGDGEF